MIAQNHYKVASKAEGFGSLIFYLVLFISTCLLLFSGPTTESCLHPCLVALAILAVACTVITTIYQTEGNRILRTGQLSDAFGAGLGEKVRDDYYNNLLPKTARRLAATTLENTFFTKEILLKMLTKERIKNGLYFILLVVLLVCRWTSTNWLLMFAQMLFSADLILKWIRLERFRIRASRVYAQLEQFFLQRGDADKPNDMAILLAAFTDYECAKDEAVIPLDQKIFEELNLILSKQWEETQQRLNMVGSEADDAATSIGFACIYFAG
jgi:hypothetical protein